MPPSKRPAHTIRRVPPAGARTIQRVPLLCADRTQWVGEQDVGMVGVILHDSGQVDGMAAGTTPVLDVEVHRHDAGACTIIVVRFPQPDAP